MEICYFSNFKAKSNFRKCTDSPEPSLIAKMRKKNRNSLFLDFLSSVEFATRLAYHRIRVFIPSMFCCFFFVFLIK